MALTDFGHKVMNCKDYDRRKFRPGGASPKADGVRGYYYPGETLLWSRNEKPLYGLDHIVDDLRKHPWPVDMELYIPGMEFNKLSGIIRNHQPTPEARGYVIDVPSPGHLQDRLNRRPTETPNISLLDYIKVKSHTHFWRLHLHWLALGWEGSVTKTLDHKYRNNRSYDWMREVPVKNEDCVVLGVYEGKGKMHGIAGGIWINFKGLECKCGTMKGLDYEDRRLLLENEDEYVGMVAEIQYKNLQPSGKPRQPRFKGWRYDKS